MAEENMKIDRVIDDQGRRVETRSYEIVVDGQKERVIETHVEQVPMALQERVVEKIAPVVTTRKKELFKDGKVVNSVVEELDNNTMKMSAVVPVTPPPVPQVNALTKEDLIEALREVMKPTVRSEEVKSEVKLKVKKPAVEEEEEEEVVKPVKVKKKAVQATETDEEVVKEGGWGEWVEIGAYTLLSGQLAFILYYLVLKNWI